MTGALLALMLLAGATPRPAGLQLFPVQGVFFPSEDEPNRIDADFRAALGGPDQVGYFADAFRRRFPQAAATISQANVRRTFAVSLQVARASRYTVPKADGNTDVLLPVTASLYFANLVTGDVLYAATRTTIQPAKLSPAEAAAGSPEIRRLFAKTFRDVVDDLIGDAGQRFQPTQLSVKVAGEWKGLAVLAGGKGEGLLRGDELLGSNGGSLQVLSAASEYAIASVTSGTFAVDESFTKFSNGTLADVKKPRVLPLVELTPDGYPAAAVVQLFSDALGASAPVSLVPLNPTHAEVLRAVRTQVDLSGEKLLQRQLPHYFVRLRVPEPVLFERPTNLAYKTVRVTSSLAYADLVDRSGRVLFTAVGRDRIEEEITGGMALAPVARREVGVKNALLDLAQIFGKTLRFESARLPVISGGEQILVKDAQGLLLPGVSLRAYRSIGKVSGIPVEVWVPTWEVEVQEVGADTAKVTAVLPVVAGAPPVEAGEVLMLDGVAREGPRRLRFGDCGAQAENLGSVGLPDEGPLAELLFAAGSKQPFYASGLKARVEGLVRSGSGFAEDLRFTEPRVDYCVQPVFRVQTEPPQCDGSVCADVAKLLSGFRIRVATADGEVRAKTGLEARMTAGALPAGTPGATREAALRADLLDEFLKLTPNAAAAVGDKKL